MDAILIVRHEDFESAPSDYEDSRRVAIVASGSSSEIATTWQRGMSAMNAINSDKTIDYKVFDPSFLAGGSGGQIQNSNSAIYTLGRAMKANRGGASIPFHRKCGLVGMLGIFLVFGLSACERDYWPQRTWVTNAAENDSKRLSDETLRYEKPFDTWVDNPKLAEAIREEIQETGRERLMDRYEFECKPRLAPDSCTDCLSCMAIFWQWARSTSSFIKPGFVHRGDARVSVEIGPGTAVSAMTYWTK